MTSFNFNYLLKDPVSTYSHIGGLELQHMNGGEHNSVHNKYEKMLNLII